jgi:hypothetical protein
MSRRSASSRIPRQDGHCTSCSEVLPKYKNNWGLVWDNGTTGMCKTCLITIRDNIGYYAEGEKPALPRKRKRKA